MTDTRPGIERAITLHGSQRLFARALSAACGEVIAQSRICIWLKQGYVPPKRAGLVAALTGIPLDDLLRSTPRKKSAHGKTASRKQAATTTTEPETSQHLPNTRDPNKYAEALAIYTADKANVDRAQGILRRHQNHFESEYGITPKVIRDRHLESKLSEKERMAVYAEEEVSRRAVDLWSAERPEEFEALIAQAQATLPASGPGRDKLAASRAYNDGFNGSAKGGQIQKDNPHRGGTELFIQWSRGCADGEDYRKNLEGTSLAATARAAAAPRPTPEPEADDSGRKAPAKGRANRKKAAAAGAQPEAEPGMEDSGGGIFGDPANTLPA